MWLFCILLVVALAFAGGYYVGQSFFKQAPLVDTIQQVQPVKHIQTRPKDTIATPVKADTTKAIPKDTATVAPVVKVAPAKETAPSEEYLKYNSKDIRLRTGAYYIMGTDFTIKTLKGDKTSTIARRTLGETMECYIEVYNDLPGNTVLEEGLEVKIPKLKLKKIVNKKKQQINNN